MAMHARHWPLEIPRDELCHFVSGRATYTHESGEVIEIVPGTVVLFKAAGKASAPSTTPCATSTCCADTSTSKDQPRDLKLDSSAPHLVHPETYPGPFKDWGVIPTMIEGESRTSGLVLYKVRTAKAKRASGSARPGYWNCHVTRDEFCHFLLGAAPTHESGEVIEIVPATVAFFPQDWKGTCRVHETIRKVYMIR